MGNRERKIAALALLVASMTAVAACSKSGSDSSKASSSPSAAQTAAPNGSASAQPAIADGPLGAYSPPITITTARSTTAGTKYQPGDSLDSNVWTKDFESKLGIKLVNKWKVDSQQYTNKVTVSMVADDMPDFLKVNAQQLKLLVDAGQAADLTDVFNKYASDQVKQLFQMTNGIAMQGATFNGKIMAIPANGGEQRDMSMLFIRKDWLDKLHLDPPKTMDDVIKIAKAFASDDPDGNGQKDTFGLSLDQNLFGGISSLDGFFNGYHAYPYNPAKGSGTTLIFLKGPDGKPMFADIQPEVKTALGKLAELFKAGAINPEFGVIDGNKSAELLTAGKVGMTFGQSWVPSWPINDMKKINPKVDWQVYPLVSADDKPVLPDSTTGQANQFYVVSKKSQHPEAMIKLLNYYIEKLYGPTADAKYHDVTGSDGTIYEVFALAPIIGGFPNKNINDSDLVTEALKTGDTSKLNVQAKSYYDNIKKYNAGDMDQWWMAKTFGPGSAYDIVGKYVKSNQIVSTRFFGQPTDTMVSKGPSLRDLEAQVFTKIIMGSSPLDAFDTDFVANWHKQGGDQIIQEIIDSGAFK